MPEKHNHNNETRARLWIVIGDIHDDVGNFANIPELKDASGVIVHGDLTTNGGIDAAKKILDDIGLSHLPVLAQTGNMDKPEIDGWLKEKGINLHAGVRELTPEIAIFGIGGSTPTPFNTPTEYTEEAYADWLAKEWEKACAYPHAALISHNPPKNTKCDAINSNLHVGSEAVRAFLEKAQPEVCICGHIHEGRGTDKIGRTVIVNPGMLSAGGYALLHYNDGKLTATLGQLK